MFTPMAPPGSPEETAAVAALRRRATAAGGECRAALDALAYEDPCGAAALLEDMTLRRALRARPGNADAALKVLVTHARWRLKKGVAALRASGALAKEAETGKVMVTGRDASGRPVVVLDNSRENTRNVKSQMAFLAWNLERAARLLDDTDGRHQWVVVIRLEDFSLFNSPPPDATSQTLNMLTDQYFERLGVALLTGSPSVFSVLWKMIEPLVGPRTFQKVCFLPHTKAEQDKKLKEVLGDDWERLSDHGPSRLDPKQIWAAAEKEDAAWAAGDPERQARAKAALVEWLR